MRGMAWMAWALVVAWAGCARASVLELFGYDARALAMANAQTAGADDYTAAFYNPANLARRKRIVAGAGFFGALPRLSVDREVVGSDVEARLPEDFAGLTIGAVFPLGGGLDDRLAVGFGVYLPAGELAEGDIADGRTPQFYRYQNLPDKFVVVGAAGFEVTEWLWVGGGVQVLAALEGGLAFEVALADRVVRSQSIGVDVALVAAPVVGVTVAPVGGLLVGVSWRDAIALDYSLPSRFVIDDLVSLDLTLNGTVLYTPASWNVGVSYLFDGIGLRVSGEFSYVRWSLAPDPSIGLEIDLGGDVLAALGVEDRLDIGSGAAVDLGFVDTGVWRVAGELRVNEYVVARGGYAWRPSPAPVPTGAFNYIDGDAHVIGGGLGVTFFNPLEERGSPAHVDVGYQLTVMEAVDVVKGAGDAVGGYVAGGVVHAVSVSFRHEL